MGDERFNFFETADGHILQKDPLGYYAYADEKGKSSGIFARNAGDRNEADALFLSKLNQYSIYERLKDESRSSENFGYETFKWEVSPNL